MPLRLTTLLATAAAAVAAVAVAVPSVAQGAVEYRAVGNQANELGSPISPVASMKGVPLGFATTAQQAVAVAERSAVMQQLHHRDHPLTYVPYVWHLGSLYWYIPFSYRRNIVAEVNVSPTGKLLAVWTGPQAIAPYARGHYAPGFDRWWVITPFSLLFLAVFLDVRRWRRLVHLDALVILSFLGSYLLLDHAHLQSAVWLAYPPLLYLLVRMLWLGFRRVRSEARRSPGADPGGLAGHNARGSQRSGGATGRLAPLFSTRALAVGLLVIVAARIALSLLSGQEIDVGYASVLGAHRIVHGLPLYFPDPGHGDTYGPINYLAYLPFELLFGAKSNWTTHLWAADLASLAFDLVTIGALFFLGRKIRSGRAGTRLGLVLAWAWAACPFTLLGLMVHTNDGLIAMLSVLSLLAFSSAAGRGAMLGLAAAAKFSPAALLALYARGGARSRKTAVACVAAFTGVVVLTIGLYLPAGGLSEFYHRTLGFQLTRPDVFSPWALHPTLDPIKTVLEIGALLLAGLVAFFPRQPRDRTLAQVCALAGAVTIAVQVPATHWFYYYILWFLPFVLVAILVPDQPSAGGTAPMESDSQTLRLERRRSERDLELIGV